VSMVRIGNSAQLESFLKILSEETGHRGISDLESRQNDMSGRIKKDLGRYASMDEQEDEEEEEEVSLQSDPEKDDLDDEQEIVYSDEQEREPAQDQQSDYDDSSPDREPEGQPDERDVSPDVTYYKIRDEINDIRAAPSLKGREVKQDMEQWLSRLSDDEKNMLFTYLDTVEKIMSSKVTGTDAQDPSEPPHSLSISGDDSGDKKRDSRDSERDSRPAPASGGEDTSPPIRAGKSQDISEVRKKMLSIMRG